MKRLQYKMKWIEQPPRKALNKAFLKVKPSRSAIETFKTNLSRLIDKINEDETEEFHKNLIRDFLLETYYRDKYFINTKGRNDLVIHTGHDAHSPVGVIIEAKSPANASEMLRKDRINTKAFQELVLYYMRERITGNNLEIKYLAATNIYEWFIFDAAVFEKAFARNSKFVKLFNDFEAGRLSGANTDFFYKQVAEPEINAIAGDIAFTYFDIRAYEKPLRNADKQDDNKLIALYKLLSPEHLLKLPFANDSNSLDKAFYLELLHIIGLSETKSGGKKLIERKKEGERDPGSLLENAISQLDSLDKISRLPKPQQFGENQQERLFNAALELVITWINRVLFLKLLEAQLIKYHQGDGAFAFLNTGKVRDYDALNSLFFQVLAKKPEERNAGAGKLFANVPYLNSSLFEPTELEHNCVFVSQLGNEKIPVLAATVLKDERGRRKSGGMDTLEYLFEFLDAYDFSSEGSEDIQEDNKTLINASVLGLIFEKINGYKDGSFFTPGFITMYMCRETIRRAVVQKFNAAKAWNCENIDQVFDKIEDKPEANRIINSLRICDPAVGSGHFLVSALNEIIAVKSDLKILLDRQGKTLRDYQIEVVNDELIVTDDNGELFEYKHLNKESQRVQEALFHEKQTIIENCLFGVDINPNSVKICRLRLWIELLKNAYYKPGGNDAELETLPNIDINIKCGNSLISRYDLDSDIKKALRKSKWTIASYRLAVMAYRNAQSKDEKRSMEKLIDTIKQDFESEINHTDKRVIRHEKLGNELNTLLNQRDFFEMSKADKNEKMQKVKKLTADLQKLETEIEEIKNNKIYENAFEWRFEFPEVLNDDGEFVGFDIVIGNPPYVQLQKDDGKLADMFKNCGYETFERTGDIYCLFYERGYQLLCNCGVLTFITNNKWMRANYGKTMRKYFVNNGNIVQLIDFGDAQFFENATTYPNILVWEKNTHKTVTKAWDLSKTYASNMSLDNLLAQQGEYEPLFNESSFVVVKGTQAAIKKKIEANGVPLKDWDVTINYGLKTGLNEAFIIDGKTRDELIAQDPKSAEIIRPILRGRDIKRYKADWAGLWLINSHNGYGNVPRIDVRKNYPAIWDYLNKFNNAHDGALERRADKGSHWSNLRNCAYVDELEKEKVIWIDMSPQSNFLYDTTHYFVLNTAYILTGTNLKYILAVMNSSVLNYYFPMISTDIRGETRRYFKQYVETFPIPKISIASQRPFELLVDQILSAKAQNQDTQALERELDQLVYELYGLTEAEIAIVEGK